MATLRRGVFGLFAALFVWAAYLQLNDAESVRWIAIYGGAAVMCGLGAARVRIASAVGVGYAVAVSVGAAYLAWQIYGVGEVTAMYGDELGGEPGLIAAKEGREMLGLVIVAAATGGYGWWCRGTHSDSGA